LVVASTRPRSCPARKSLGHEGKEAPKMKFDDNFRAEYGDENMIFIRAGNSSSGRIKFLISTQIQIDRLHVKNPVNAVAALKTCDERRDEIKAACRRAFKRDMCDCVSLTDADFVVTD
jgi:hypothetical protein